MSEMVGVSLTGLTVTSNVSVEKPPLASVTCTVIVAVARGVRRRRDGHCAIRSHTAEHNVAVRDQAGIAAGAGDGQAGGGRFGVAHDEGQGGRRSVFVDHLVRDVGDRRKIVHTVHVQSERIGRGRSVRIRYLDRDIRAAGGIRSGCHRDGSIRSATSQHDVGDRDDRNIAGGNVECQAAGRCFQIADRERDRAGRLIFVRQLVGNIGDRWRIVDRRHDQIERFDRGGVVGIGHRDRDGRGAERVGDRRQRDRAVGAAAAERDARVGDNCLIAGNGRQCQAVGRRFEIANRERNRAVGVSSCVNWLLMSVMVGGAFVKNTFKLNVSVAMSPSPSITFTVITAEPLPGVPRR